MALNSKKDILLVCCYGNLDDSRSEIEKQGLYNEYIPGIIDKINKLSSTLACYVVCGGYTRMDLPGRSEAHDMSDFLQSSLPEYVKADLACLIQSTARNTPQNIVFGIITAIGYLQSDSLIHIICDAPRMEQVEQITSSLQNEHLKFQIHSLPRSDVPSSLSEDDKKLKVQKNKSELDQLKLLLDVVMSNRG